MRLPGGCPTGGMAQLWTSVGSEAGKRASFVLLSIPGYVTIGQLEMCGRLEQLAASAPLDGAEYDGPLGLADGAAGGVTIRTATAASRGSAAEPVVFEPGTGGRVELWGGVGAGDAALALGLVEDDRAGDGDVEALDHAGHGDAEASVGGGDRLGGDAAHLVAEDEGGWAEKVGVEEVDAAVAEVGGEDGETVLTQEVVAGFDGGMVVGVDPLCGAGGGGTGQGTGWERFGGVDEMDGEDADRVARPKDRADVVRIVDVFEDDGQVGLATGQDGRDATAAALCWWPLGRFRGHRLGQLAAIGGVCHGAGILGH